MQIAAQRQDGEPAGEPSGEPDGSPPWRVPLTWRILQQVGRIVIPIFCRFRVTGEVSPGHRAGPLILAANHISNFDPFCMTPASRSRGLAPRMMATGGLFRAPVIGRVMTAAGHIPVDRGRDTVAQAVPTAVAALRAGSVVGIYPEGRIGLDPGIWPERAKTGLARLALSTRAPVVPVAIWGSHEVIAYHGRGAMARTLISAIWRRPTVRMHFGEPVDLSDLREGAIGHAQRATDRIMTALSTELATLRTDQPRLPRFIDPTRPISTARSYRTKKVGGRDETESGDVAGRDETATIRMIDHGDVVRAAGP